MISPCVSASGGIKGPGEEAPLMPCHRRVTALARYENGFFRGDRLAALGGGQGEVAHTDQVDEKHVHV